MNKKNMHSLSKYNTVYMWLPQRIRSTTSSDGGERLGRRGPKSNNIELESINKTTSTRTTPRQEKLI
jgi:hypothetical protein